MLGSPATTTQVTGTVGCSSLSAWQNHLLAGTRHHQASELDFGRDSSAINSACFDDLDTLRGPHYHIKFNSNDKVTVQHLPSICLLMNVVAHGTPPLLSQIHFLHHFAQPRPTTFNHNSVIATRHIPSSYTTFIDRSTIVVSPLPTKHSPTSPCHGYKPASQVRYPNSPTLLLQPMRPHHRRFRSRRCRSHPSSHHCLFSPPKII